MLTYLVVDNHILDYLADLDNMMIIFKIQLMPITLFLVECQKNVASNQKYLDCISCNGTPTVDDYSLRPANDKTKWCCNKCLIIKNATIFPYGLENNVDLISRINCD